MNLNVILIHIFNMLLNKHIFGTLILITILQDKYQ